MSARSFRSVGWVASVGAAALGCYMLSLQVAAERAELASVERRILDTRRQIRSLQTELGTRGRLQQLEQWNAEVLALSAPVAGQFLDNPLMLARFGLRRPAFRDGAPVRMASAETGTAPAASAAQAPAQPQRAVAGTAAPPAVVPELPPAPRQARPLVRQVSLAVPAQEDAPSPAAAAATRSMPPARPAAGGPLLDERTLRDLGEAARAEREGGAGR